MKLFVYGIGKAVAHNGASSLSELIHSQRKIKGRARTHETETRSGPSYNCRNGQHAQCVKKFCTCSCTRHACYIPKIV